MTDPQFDCLLAFFVAILVSLGQEVKDRTLWSSMAVFLAAFFMSASMDCLLGRAFG